ncbi:MAG: hypothetical protein GX606_01675 [Elusimicrobia bacterium]|nr:hypothetical protein [Elusimicrobiota bacterium]
MIRIGIAASKIAKGDLFRYNLHVVVLSFLVSLLLFFLSGFVLFLVLSILSLFFKGLALFRPGGGISEIFGWCLVFLSGIVTGIAGVAIIRNFRVK